MKELEVSLIALLGVVLGIVATAFWQWLDRKERYQVMTFEKRLIAHQRAYALNQKIYSALNSGNTNRMLLSISTARDWWEENCLYLDQKSRRSFLVLIGAADYYAHNLNNANASIQDSIQRVWAILNNNLEDVCKGIGMEYLPTAIRSQIGNTHNKNGVRIWLRNYGLDALFFIFMSFVFGMLGYCAYLFYQDNKLTKILFQFYIFSYTALYLSSIITYLTNRQRRFISFLSLLLVLITMVVMWINLPILITP